MIEKKQLHVLENWPGRQGLQFIETFTWAELELCNMMDGLFDTLNNNSVCNITKCEIPPILHIE